MQRIIPLLCIDSIKLTLCVFLISFVTTTAGAQNANKEHEEEGLKTSELTPVEKDILRLENERKTNPGYYVETPLAYAYLSSKQYEKVIELLKNLEDRHYREMYLGNNTNPNYHTTLDLYLGIAYSETGNDALARHFLNRAKKWLLQGVCKGKLGPCYSKEKMRIVNAYRHKKHGKHNPELFSKAISTFYPYAGVQ